MEIGQKLTKLYAKCNGASDMHRSIAWILVRATTAFCVRLCYLLVAFSTKNCSVYRPEQKGCLYLKSSADCLIC